MNVAFNGQAQSTDEQTPDLTHWGFSMDRRSELIDDGPWWSISGTFENGQLSYDDANEQYHLRINSIPLGPDEQLTLILPFVEIDYDHLFPEPSRILGRTARGEHPKLVYQGEEEPLTIEIPFTPVRKEIAVTITPLAGEMLLGHSHSFRISGSVVFGGFQNPETFNRYCSTDPLAGTTGFPAAYLLYSLDHPPATRLGAFSDIYRGKLSWIEVRAEVHSCQIDDGNTSVEATFNGRAFAVDHDQSDKSRLEEDWLRHEAANREIQLPWGDRAYQLSLGNIILGPHDSLTVTLDGADIREVRGRYYQHSDERGPPPTRRTTDSDGGTIVAYDGPQHPFVLEIVYVPTIDMVFGQFPTTARTLTRPAEVLFDRVRVLLILGAAGLVTLLLARRLKRANVARALSGMAWITVSLALLYGLRGVFGLLVVAALTILVYRESTSRFRYMATGLTMLVLVLAALALDEIAEDPFTYIIALDLELTPITPLILLLLGVVLGTLLILMRSENDQFLQQIEPAVVLGLLAFALFDVLQKSFLSLIIIGLGLAFIASRVARLDGTSILVGLTDRLYELWTTRVIPFGSVILIVFMAQQDYLNMTIRHAGGLGIWWDPLALPVLSLATIILQFASIGLLFVILYPVLPFSSGYLKASTFSLFLWLVFLAGLGADDRLIANWESVAIGRLVYYLAVPLLIGLYDDIHKAASMRTAQQAEAGVTGASSFGGDPAGRFHQMQRAAGSLAAIATLIAPAAYTTVTGVPVVTTFFQLMTELLALSAGS